MKNMEHGELDEQLEMNKQADECHGVQHASAETIKHNATSDTSLTLSHFFLFIRNEPHACFSGTRNGFNQKKLLKPNGLNTMLVTVYHLHSTRNIFCYMACSNKQTGFPYSPQLYYVRYNCTSCLTLFNSVKRCMQPHANRKLSQYGSIDLYLL